MFLHHRRTPGADSIPPQALLLKNPSSVGGEVNPSRHVVHAPVPCRPQPIKTCPVPLPWAFPESCDWMLLQPSSKASVPRFPSLIPTSRQVFGSSWPKQSSSHPKEPTVVFRLKSLQEPSESRSAPQEKKEVPHLKVEKGPAWLREASDGPLDLSDRGKPKQAPADGPPLTVQGGEKPERSPDKEVKTGSSPPVSISSPSPVMSPSLSSSSTPPVKQEEELATDLNHKVTERTSG